MLLEIQKEIRPETMDLMDLITLAIGDMEEAGILKREDKSSAFVLINILLIQKLFDRFVPGESLLETVLEIFKNIQMERVND